MESEKIGVCSRLRMMGLKNKGIIEISQDPKSGTYVLIMSKGIRRKWLVFNFPEAMWRVRCSKAEIPEVASNFLADKILAG